MYLYRGQSLKYVLPCVTHGSHMTSSAEVKMMCNVWTTDLSCRQTKADVILAYLVKVLQVSPFTLSNGNTCKLQRKTSDLRSLLEKLRRETKRERFALESCRTQRQQNALFKEAILKISGGGNPSTLPGWRCQRASVTEALTACWRPGTRSPSRGRRRC